MACLIIPDSRRRIDLSEERKQSEDLRPFSKILIFLLNVPKLLYYVETHFTFSFVYSR